MNVKQESKSTDSPCAPQYVHLERKWPGAQEVCIAGSFNDWHPSVTPMIRLDDGEWAKELALPPGRYEYRFVVDGEWVDDPAAAELIPNPFGSVNAVLAVAARQSIASADSASVSTPARSQTTKLDSSAQSKARSPKQRRP